jgi:cell division protein ZapA
MASVDIEVASRRYTIACRDGEEAHLKALAAIVDKKAKDAAKAVGSMAEGRNLLFACLLLADDLVEQRRAGGGAMPGEDEETAEAVELVAERLERLADALEAQGA